jgi:putative ABC transport system permease protein
MILTLVGISRGMIEDTLRRTRNVGADIMIRPPKSSIINLTGAPIPAAIVDVVRKVPHVDQATGVVVHNYAALANITGIDYGEMTRMNGGFTYLSGGPFQERNDMIVDEYFAQQKGLKVGDVTEISNQKWRVCGIVQANWRASWCSGPYCRSSSAARAGSRWCT